MASRFWAGRMWLAIPNQPLFALEERGDKRAEHDLITAIAHEIAQQAWAKL